MQVYEVIPLIKARILPETLSYFSTKEISRGAVVKISFRRREIFAVVNKRAALLDLKAELKKRDFRLRAIKTLVSDKFLGEERLELLKEISKTLLLPAGVLISNLFPKLLFSKKNEIVLPGRGARRGAHQKFAFRGGLQERIQYYRSLVREHFAREKSLLLLSPRLEIIKILEKEIGRGI